MKNAAYLLLAIFLSVLLIPIGITYTILRYIIFPYHVWQTFSNFMLKWALSIDGLGNVILATLLNDIMITKKGYPFGNWHETISQVIGDNQLNGTLTKSGHIFNKILDKVFEPNHCLNAVRNKKLRCLIYLRRLETIESSEDI